MLGLDNYENYRRQQLATSARARLLNQMEPRLRMNDNLEAIFGSAIKQQEMEAARGGSGEGGDRLQELMSIFEPDAGY